MGKLFATTALFAFSCLHVAPAAANTQATGQPKDQEECTDKAAKEAKTTTGVLVMVENCKKRFPAVRNLTGGYSFFDNELKQWIPVSGPKLSQADLNSINALRILESTRQSTNQQMLENEKTQRQELEKRVSASLILLDSKFGCKDAICAIRTIEFKVQNNSDKNVEYMKIDYEIGKDLNCSSISMNKNMFVPIKIPPSVISSTIYEMNAYESLTLSGNTFCRKISGVTLAR